MLTMQRSCWAVLGLTLSWAQALAQAPQTTAAPAPAQTTPTPPAPTQTTGPGRPGAVSDVQTAPTPPAPAQTAPAAPANAVVATVNGQAIPETAVQRSLQHVPPAKQAEARPQIIHFLVDQVLLDQYLLQQRIAVEPKEIDKFVEDMKADLTKQKKDFAKALVEMKLTEAELREHIAADIRWGKFTEARATDKVLKDLFDSQKYLFDGSMVRARHILLTIPAGDAKAEEQTVAQLQAIKQEINKQVADGLANLPADTDNLNREKKRQALLEEAFSTQAKAKSACPSKAKGGDVEWFQGVGFMVEPFSRAAFALKPFEISEPVKTPFGHHLILVTDRKPGREVKFEEVKEMVKDHYCNGLHDSIVGEARQRSKIVINSGR
jgi:peptidyl-prolyl cis-trans isomerase C